VIQHSNKIFVGVEQRLDGMTERGAWPSNYVRLSLEDDGTTHRINVSVDVALKLSKGLSKAARMARPKP